MNINGLKVPIPSGSLNIAGGVAYRENPDAEFGFDQIFIPPTDGTKGVYSSPPIEVPGGIFGLGIPFPPGGLTTIKQQSNRSRCQQSTHSNSVSHFRQD